MSTRSKVVIPSVCVGLFHTGKIDLCTSYFGWLCWREKNNYGQGLGGCRTSCHVRWDEWTDGDQHHMAVIT